MVILACKAGVVSSNKDMDNLGGPKETAQYRALGGRGRRISEFGASLVYRVSSRTARATQRNPVSKKQTNKTKQNKTKESHTRLGSGSKNL